MRSLKRLLADITPLLGKENKLAEIYRRVLAPAGARLSRSGSLFALSQHEPIHQQLGETQQQYAILRWLKPADTGQNLDDGDVAEDIASLLAVAIRRRVRAIPEFMLKQEGATATIFTPSSYSVDSELVAPIPAGALDGLEDLMWSILSIQDEKQFTAISQAMRLYHTATLVMAADASAAYTLLVAALETLATTFETGPGEWKEYSQAADWDRAFDRAGLDDTQRTAMRAYVIGLPHLNLKRRFIAFCLRSVPPAFWTEPWTVWGPELRIERGTAHLTGARPTERATDERSRHGEAELRSLLGNVYDARSGYAHEGKRVNNAELFGFESVQASADEGPTLRKRDDLPSLEYLERLTHAILRTTIEAAMKDPEFKRPDLVFSDPSTTVPPKETFRNGRAPRPRSGRRRR